MDIRRRRIHHSEEFQRSRKTCERRASEPCESTEEKTLSKKMHVQVPHGASTSKSRRNRGAAEEPRCVNFSFIGRTPAGHESVRLERHHDVMLVPRVPQAEPEFDGLPVIDEAEHAPGALAKVRRPIMFTVDMHVSEIVVSTA